MKWIAPIYLLGLVGLILYIEPRILEFRDLRAVNQPLNYVFGPFQNFSSDEKFESVATSLYRGGYDRLGIYSNENVSLDLHVKVLKDLVNFDVHQASKASPAIDDSGIYVGSDSGWFYKFSHSGELQWKFNFANSSKGVHSTAALDQKRVYIGAYNGRVYALDKQTGHPEWVIELGAAIGSSPVIYKGYLYVGVEVLPPNGFLAKVSLQDGRLEWASPWLGGHPHSSPTLWPEKDLVFIGANSSKMFAIKMQTGEILWSTPAEGQVKGTPVLGQDVLAFTSWGRKIFGVNPETGEQLWETFLNGESQSSPVYLSQFDAFYVYSSGGRLTAVSRKTGDILWQNIFVFKRAITSVTATHSIDAKHWILWGSCGDEDFCAFDPKDGRILKKWQVGKLTGVPVAFNKELYLSLDYPGSFIKLTEAFSKVEK